MEDENKTKEQLIEELNKLRQYIAELKGFAEEIKQARVNQEKFAKAFLQNSIPVGITTLTEGRFIDVSNAFLKLMGRKREEVVGHTSTDIGFITEEQRVIFFDELNKKGRVENLEMKVRTEGGALRDGLFNAVTMNFNNEEHLLTVVTDISERKRMEETLIESEQRLMQAQAIAHLGSWEIDLKNQMMWASEEAFRIYGIEYTGPASACMPLAEAQKVVHPEDRPGMDGALKALLKENKRYDQEFRIFRVNDGELRVIHSRADILFSGTRHPVKVFGTLQDITDRKQAEEALRESEEKYRYITERMSDVVWTLDSNFRAQYVSPSVFKALGFTPEERIRQPIFERITPESFQKVEEVLKFELQRDLESGVDPDRTVTLELEYYHKNGSVVWHETVVSGIRDTEGNIIGFHGASRDVTKRKKIEK
ncbi:MAG TPA: PAS domain S-box protein, partial [Syntrophales bacterium]